MCYGFCGCGGWEFRGPYFAWRRRLALHPRGLPYNPPDYKRWLEEYLKDLREEMDRVEEEIKIEAGKDRK